MNTCDNWVVIHITSSDPHYRVLTGTSGGYTDGDSWSMNSGIVRIEEDGDYYLVYGASGSVYKCHKESYTLRMNNAHVWESLKVRYKDKVTVMEDTTDWLNHDWSVK